MFFKKKRRKRTDITVNRHVIAANKKQHCREPVLKAEDYKQNRYGHCLIVRDDSGTEVFRLVYDPDNPMDCGATAYGSTYLDVEVLDYVPPMLKKDFEYCG